MNDRPEGFPHPVASVECEWALLGAVLINNTAYHVASGVLRAEHFYDPLNGRVWESFDRIIGGGGLADANTIQAEIAAWAQLQQIRGGTIREHLANLARNAETILSVGEYARTIVEFAGRRRLAELARDAANIAADASVEQSFAEQTAALRRHLDDLDETHQVRPQWLSTVDVLARELERRTSGTRIWATRIKPLDDALGGGLMTGRLYGLEARSKQFKTGSMGTIAQAMLDQDCPFLYIALEMDSARIIERLVAHRTKCNAMNFERWSADAPERIQRYMTAYGSRRGYWAHAPGCSFSRLRSIASSAADRLGVQVLFVDYWQLVTGAKRGQNMAEHLTDVAQWLAAFCGQHDVAGVVASQTNREGFGFGSDGLAKACDWLGRLHKLEQRSMTGDFETLWIEVLHNRGGTSIDIGSKDAPAFRIDKIGPVLRAIDDWDTSYLPMGERT